ncbi:uncharacterized protein LOC107399647 [Peromyscus maniculatus bairdii]|uniref:uncharacterized protein LOC107399647 n=1 Tax=Peromyscus maniculatus bairdii TaxID=230844 RepID=UPI003FD66696
MESAKKRRFMNSSPCTLHRMAAGNAFRSCPEKWARVTEIPLRFKSGVTEKSMLSHGLLDPTEPWRLGSEILPKHSICAGRGVPGLGGINPVGSQLENILRIAHSIMSLKLFPLSTSWLEEHRITHKIAESEKSLDFPFDALKDRGNNKAAWLHFSPCHQLRVKLTNILRARPISFTAGWQELTQEIN